MSTITKELQAGIQAQAVKTAEAAQRLNLSEKTIRSLVARGLLKPNRATRHYLFAIRELDRFLNESSANEPAKTANQAEHNLGSL